VLRHPWKGDDNCRVAAEYRDQLTARKEHEAQNLARLTGWDLQEIRRKMNLHASASKPGQEQRWWEKIWKGNDATPIPAQ
jgi:hypothetical protein